MSPIKAGHRCGHGRCNQIIPSGQSYCPAHARLHRQYDKKRPSSGVRSYDANWQKFRKMYLNANPLCQQCAEEGRTTTASVVDHILPMRNGGSKYDEDNLQPLCKFHHDQKTAREDGAFGNK